MPSALLNAYLDRIGLADPGSPTIETLRRLHAAHVEAIPFENLDILLGRPVRLDLDRLRHKLIDERRGGYCFEQNTLLLAVLRESGFSAIPLEARVRTGSSAVLPRTHMAIGVEIGGDRWLADVGFGAEGPLEPIPMRGDGSPPAAGLAHRVVQEGHLHVLQMRPTRGPGWADQYAFLLQPVYPADIEVANWFTSTHPESRFVRVLTAQRATRDVRYVLRYPQYTEIDDRGPRTQEIGRGELMPLLRRAFRIDLPDDTVFPAVDVPAGRRPF